MNHPLGRGALATAASVAAVAVAAVTVSSVVVAAAYRFAQSPLDQEIAARRDVDRVTIEALRSVVAYVSQENTRLDDISVILTSPPSSEAYKQAHHELEALREKSHELPPVRIPGSP